MNFFKLDKIFGRQLQYLLTNLPKMRQKLSRKYANRYASFNILFIQVKMIVKEVREFIEKHASYLREQHATYGILSHGWLQRKFKLSERFARDVANSYNHSYGV